MTDNISIKDSAGTDTTVKTTDNAGVHTPHHNVDALPAAVVSDIAAIKTALQIIDNIVAGAEAQVDIISAPAIAAGSNLIGKVNIQQANAFTRAAVSQNTSGDQTIVAGTGGQTIRVCGLFLMGHGDVNITFKSNTTAISGVLPLAVKGNGLLLPVVEDGWHYLVTASGEALIINLSASVEIGGFIVYRKS